MLVPVLKVDCQLESQHSSNRGLGKYYSNTIAHLFTCNYVHSDQYFWASRVHKLGVCFGHTHPFI